MKVKQPEREARSIDDDNNTLRFTFTNPYTLIFLIFSTGTKHYFVIHVITWVTIVASSLWASKQCPYGYEGNSQRTPSNFLQGCLVSNVVVWITVFN
jgi:hypothetical protein